MQSESHSNPSKSVFRLSEMWMGFSCAHIKWSYAHYWSIVDNTHEQRSLDRFQTSFSRESLTQNRKEMSNDQDKRQEVSLIMQSEEKGS